MRANGAIDPLAKAAPPPKRGRPPKLTKATAKAKTAKATKAVKTKPPKVAKAPPPPKVDLDAAPDVKATPFSTPQSLLDDLVDASAQSPGTALPYYARTGSTGQVFWFMTNGGRAIGVTEVDKWMKANKLDRAGVEARVLARQTERESRKRR